MGTVFYLADRRWWPVATDAWSGGWRAAPPSDLPDDLHDEWRASMRRLARRLGTTVTTSCQAGRPVAVANGGYPLAVVTAEQKADWDMLRADEQ